MRTSPARVLSVPMLALALAGALAIALAGAGHAAAALVDGQLRLAGKTHALRLPAGLVLEVLNTGLRAPRLLAFAPDGELYIGSKRGFVYRLPPPYERAYSFADIAGYPHSIAFHDQRILIARTDGLYAAPWAPGETRLRTPLRRLAMLAASGGHDSRSVGVGPDGRIYLSLGISGNCNDELLSPDYAFGRRRGGVLVLDESVNPARWQVFAAGLRNPVGFAWHLQTGVMYASNNGPDHLGFELPPEYFSRVNAGSFHGMPWFQFYQGKVRRDPCIDSAPPRPASAVIPPVATFPARNAPMGVAFVPPGALLAEFANDAIVALRGSWGTAPSGSYLGDAATRRHPGLVRVHFRDGTATGEVSDLLRGFQLADGERWARPVGVAVGPDGALYFTSDEGVNGLFRLRRQ